MQKDRKKEHKLIVKKIQKINKSLKNDTYIGCNRFKVYLDQESMMRFADGSGLKLFMQIRLVDSLGGNSAIFDTTNFRFQYDIGWYLNDFLVRCSSGQPGHFPPLRYIELNINNVIKYK